MLRNLFRIGVALCATVLSCGALAQAWPSHPIKFIVPYTPGTGMDMIARAVGPKLAERLRPPGGGEE